MMLLALDTSSHWLSVAVGNDEGWIARDVEVGPGHSGTLLPLIDETLDEAGVSLRQLTAIAFGAGPGSFTGVRIACGVAQGLALGSGLPLVPVCSLLAIAEEARQQHGAHNVWTMTDARMQEIYAAAWRYRQGAWQEAVAPMVGGVEAVIAQCRALGGDERWCAAGDALHAYPELADAFAWQFADAHLRPTAAAIGALALPRAMRGDTVQARDAAPLYVRQRVALTRAERAAGKTLGAREENRGDDA